jgi:heme a synthase
VPALAIPRALPRTPAAERQVALWLLACCAMVFLMVLIGGITRLTESGLSITQWQPVAGVIPPLDEAQWQAEFARYQAIPQYRAIHEGMTLAEFKGIFFWEYLHRLWGRLIGLVFAGPFLYFLARRRIPAGFAPKLAGIFALGALQGVVGWYMVASGLEDRIEVSQYRLALHLAMAVLIYAAMFWAALDLYFPSPFGAAGRSAGEALRRGASLVLLLVFVTMVAGSFVAGTRAGYLDNTFPLMEGSFVPPGYWHEAPWWRNFFENLVAVQFDHRVLAETTFAATIALWLASLRAALAPGLRLAMNLMAAAAVLQLGLGIATLLLVVPLPIAVAHQGGALLLLTAALAVRHGLAHAPPV